MLHIVIFTVTYLVEANAIRIKGYVFFKIYSFKSKGIKWNGEISSIAWFPFPSCCTQVNLEPEEFLLGVPYGCRNSHT